MKSQLIENIISVDHLAKYAAIIGESPSKGARSPSLWNIVFEHYEFNCKMVPLDVQVSNLNNLLNYLNEDDKFLGGAIAVPYKELVAKWLGDNISAEAKKIGAVNCIYRNSNGNLEGTNTDGEAALVTFKERFGELKSKSVMILGLGGAGKAVASYFSSNAKSTIIISRSKVDERYAKKINAVWNNWMHIDKIIKSIDIVINCTSIGFGNQELKSPLSNVQISNLNKTSVIFDIIYQPLKTKLLERAKNHGLPILNGLDMNLEQAVLAYQYAVKLNSSPDEIRKIMSKI